MLRIGLTGGIASGKSTIAEMFAALGAEIIDTDDIAHQLVAPGGAAIDTIVETFGKDAINNEGALDRPRMRSIVFENAGKRRELEAILHPLIRQAALARARASSAPYVIVVVPLLFDTGFDQLVDRTVAVDCPESIQLKRVTQRDGVSESAGRAIIDSQMSREQRNAAADDLIDSSVSIADTRKRVAELHDQYMKLSGNCSEAQGRAE